MTFTSGSTLVAAAFAAALAFALRLLAVRLALVGLRARFGPFAGVYHAISEGRTAAGSRAPAGGGIGAGSGAGASCPGGGRARGGRPAVAAGGHRAGRTSTGVAWRASAGLRRSAARRFAQACFGRPGSARSPAAPRLPAAPRRRSHHSEPPPRSGTEASAYKEVKMARKSIVLKSLPSIGGYLEQLKGQPHRSAAGGITSYVPIQCRAVGSAHFLLNRVNTSVNHHWCLAIARLRLRPRLASEFWYPFQVSRALALTSRPRNCRRGASSKTSSKWRTISQGAMIWGGSFGGRGRLPSADPVPHHIHT